MMPKIKLGGKPRHEIEEHCEELSSAVKRNEELLDQGHDSRISSPCWTVYANKLTADDIKEIKKYRRLPKNKRQALPEVEIFKDTDGKHRFRLVAHDGEVLFASAEGYVGRATCLNAAHKAKAMRSRWTLPIFVLERAKFKMGGEG